MARVNARPLSDPPTRSQLEAYVHKAETFFLQLETVSRKVSGGCVSLLSGGPAASVPADTSSAFPVSANAPASIPPCPSPFLLPASGASANGQSMSSPQSKQITLDDLAPFRGIAYAKETMPEPYCAMLEKRMDLPSPALTHS
jgi:hypothetical protein